MTKKHTLNTQHNIVDNNIRLAIETKTKRDKIKRDLNVNSCRGSCLIFLVFVVALVAEHVDGSLRIRHLEHFHILVGFDRSIYE